MKGVGFEENFESANDGVKATAVSLKCLGMGGGLVGGNAARLGVYFGAVFFEVFGDGDLALGGVPLVMGGVNVKEFPQGAIDEITEV